MHGLALPRAVHANSHVLPVSAGLCITMKQRVVSSADKGLEHVMTTLDRQQTWVYCADLREHAACVTAQLPR